MDTITTEKSPTAEVVEAAIIDGAGVLATLRLFKAFVAARNASEAKALEAACNAHGATVKLTAAK